MNVLKTKTWSWLDIGLLKWCCILLGIVAGAYYHEYVTPYLRVILGAAILLAIRPAISYWRD